MMPTTLGQGRRRTGHRIARPRIAKFEPLEGRDLLSTVAFHSPAGLAPVQVAAQPRASSLDGPRVAFAQFRPLSGQVLVQFGGDPAGYDVASLTNPANYSFGVVQATAKLPSKPQSRPKAGVVLAPAFRVTGVSLAPSDAPGLPRTVVVSIDNNQPIRPGIYRFAIRSGGVVDLEGRPLDGTFNGTFPSGGGATGGGDFVTLLEQSHRTVIPAQPTSAGARSGGPKGVVPAYVFLPSTRAVEVRYAAAKPGQFMLAGGNNITLIPLAGQDFPGTYRLPKPAVKKP